MKTAEKALGNLSGGQLLDVATGSGGFISFLRDSLNDYVEITGIDISERPLEAARKAFTQDNIHLICMDAAQMNFPDNHFDTVCIANSLHHMADLPGVLVEMKRVCKPAGHIIIAEMYRDNQTETQLTHVLLHHWWAAIDTAEGIFHRETYTRQQVVEIIDGLNLHNVKSYELKDLDLNPKEPELIKELNSIIDHYCQRITYPDGSELLRRAEELRKRVDHVGFHGASSLLVIGEK